MRESNDKKGYTQVDHITFDIILPTLTPPAQLVFLRIYRQTIGWRNPDGSPKRDDAISLSQFRKYTHYKDDKTIRKGIEELKTRELITVSGEGTETKKYSINFDKYPDA